MLPLVKLDGGVLLGIAVIMCAYNVGIRQLATLVSIISFMSESGRHFDNGKHFLDFLHVLRQEKKEGAVRVGIFGSRKSGTHTPGVSDTDVLVVKKGVPNVGEYKPYRGDINVVRVPPRVTGESKNAKFLRDQKKKTRWLG